MNSTITRKAIRSTMAESYRRSGGQTVTFAVPGATVVAPAFIHTDGPDGEPRVVNTGQTVLDALDIHREWTGTLRGAVAELATRWQDMLDHPNRPELALVAIHYVLDLDTLVSGAWAE